MRSRPRASRTSRRCSDARSGSRAASRPSPLVLVQRFLHNSTEGWALALTSLRDLYANAESIGHADPAERRAMVDEQDAAFLAESMRLGKVIAEMHLALAAGAPGTDMAPAPLTEAALNALGEQP